MWKEHNQSMLLRLPYTYIIIIPIVLVFSFPPKMLSTLRGCTRRALSTRRCDGFSIVVLLISQQFVSALFLHKLCCLSFLFLVILRQRWKTQLIPSANKQWLLINLNEQQMRSNLSVRWYRWPSWEPWRRCPRRSSGSPRRTWTQIRRASPRGRRWKSTPSLRTHTSIPNFRAYESGATKEKGGTELSQPAAAYPAWWRTARRRSWSSRGGTWACRRPSPWAARRSPCLALRLGFAAARRREAAAARGPGTREAAGGDGKGGDPRSPDRKSAGDEGWTGGGADAPPERAGSGGGGGEVIFQEKEKKRKKRSGGRVGGWWGAFFLFGWAKSVKTCEQ